MHHETNCLCLRRQWIELPLPTKTVDRQSPAEQPSHVSATGINPIRRTAQAGESRHSRTVTACRVENCYVVRSRTVSKRPVTTALRLDRRLLCSVDIGRASGATRPRQRTSPAASGTEGGAHTVDTGRERARASPDPYRERGETNDSNTPRTPPDETPENRR